MNARAVETVPPAAPCAPDVAHVAPRLAAMLRPLLYGTTRARS